MSSRKIKLSVHLNSKMQKTLPGTGRRFPILIIEEPLNFIHSETSNSEFKYDKPFVLAPKFETEEQMINFLHETLMSLSGKVLVLEDADQFLWQKLATKKCKGKVNKYRVNTISKSGDNRKSKKRKRK